MRFRLGEAEGMDALREMRKTLINQSDHEDRQALEKERWSSFDKAAHSIQESVEKGDLKELVSSVRRMKNLLRRPSVRKDLARMEQEEKKGATASSKEKKKPEGSCSCSACGETIDGYRDCVEGALCTKCALKSRKEVPGEKEKKKSEKKAKKGMPFPPELIGMGGGDEAPAGGEGEAPPEEEPSKEPTPEEPPPKEEPKSLRKRKKKKKDKRRQGDEDEQELKRGGKNQRRQENKKLRRRDYSKTLEEFDL